MRTFCGALVATVMLWICSPSLVVGQCVGDCNGDGVVRIDEVITGVNLAFSQEALERCPGLDQGDGRVDVADLLRAVNHALTSCSFRILTYTLAGTINGEQVTGMMIVAFASLELNLEHWNVSSFTFGQLSGFGSATYFTGDHTFSIYVTATTSDGSQVALTGGATAPIPNPDFIFEEFTVAGEGYTLQFSATRIDATRGGLNEAGQRLVNVFRRLSVPHQPAMGPQGLVA